MLSDFEIIDLYFAGGLPHDQAFLAWQRIKDKPNSDALKHSHKCKCDAEAVYHYCRICWCLEIDSQKQADNSQKQLCLTCSRLDTNGGSCQPNIHSFVTACGGYTNKNVDPCTCRCGSVATHILCDSCFNGAVGN
jgi:hypothetical protein